MSIYTYWRLNAELSLVCATDETKTLVKSVCETAPQLCTRISGRTIFGVFKKASVYFPITFRNLLSPLGARRRYQQRLNYVCDAG